MKNRLLSLALVVTSLALPIARAEEGGGGHYAPGAFATFADTLPGRTSLSVANWFMYYDGSAGASRPLPIGGQLTFGTRAQVYSDLVLGIYETPLKLLGGDYAAGLGLPYAWMEVDAKVTGPLGNTIRMRDTANGLGDLALLPLMLGWTNGGLKYSVLLIVYAPTGDYDAGQLANLGKHYWTFEPTVSASWISKKIGLETTAFAALDFSTKNDATDYQSGDVFHLDVTVAEHLPLGKLGVIGLGANAFYYQQITGDRGSGARLGDFEGHTVGVGPVLSFVAKLGKTDLVAELKWLPELDVEKRLKGDYIWFKLGAAF